MTSEWPCFSVPSDVARPDDVDPGAGLLSLTEAAELIGISRPATHQALVEKRLRGRRIGKAWIVARTDAEAFKKSRSGRASGSGKGGKRRPS